ncbi:hypothetical protein DSM100685_1010 [Bifidobacterium avesanii]|nr:hypothetical protein DSM100685_1010 [Bifidobacterium avesanii]
MVQAHAMMHGLESRSTEDADLLIDVLVHHNAVREVRDNLQSLGFAVVEGTLTGYTTRMRRGPCNVDLLVDNHLSPFLRRRAELNGYKMLGMPGSRKAVARSMFVDLEWKGEIARICMPDLLGALLMKAASWREARQDDVGRHLQDCAVLASLVDDPVRELLRLNNRSRSDRKNVRTLRDGLMGHPEFFRTLDPRHRMRAERTLGILARLLDMPRKYGSVEEYVLGVQ